MDLGFYMSFTVAVTGKGGVGKSTIAALMVRRLIEQRRWTDRNDQVDAATVEWMRALGFEVGQPRESGPKL